jgi:hypothetical protein
VLRRRIGPLRRHGAAPDPGLAEGVDAVLISHLHHDHADVPSLRRLSRTVPVLAAPGSGDFLARRGFGDVRELAPGDSGSVGGVRVTATEANHPAGGRRFERASRRWADLPDGGASTSPATPTSSTAWRRRRRRSTSPCCRPWAGARNPRRGPTRAGSGRRRSRRW